MPETVQDWKRMQRNLLELLQEVVGAESDQLPWTDIDKIVDGVSSHDEPLESDIACHIANLQVCAVQLYKLQNSE